MVERLRLFVGANELTVSNATYIKSYDTIVNNASCQVIANSNITAASTIDFRKDDGVTSVFSGKVEEIKKSYIWDLMIKSNGFELNNIRVEQVYTSQSPEAIVEDIIDNKTSTLTYASTTTSGFTISKYIARGYAIDIIKDMLDLLDWQMRIDENDNVYFEPKGNINNGVTLTEGEDFRILEWKEDKNSIVNRFKIFGGFQNMATQETVSGTGTTFTLDKKPSGVLRATVGGSEVDVDSVDAENKQVTLASSQTDPTFFYSYDKPIVVDNQDDDSITDYGERFKEIDAPWLTSFEDARKYLQSLLVAFAPPHTTAKGEIPSLDYSLDVGEVISVVDDIRGITENLVISKITYKATGKTIIEFGSRDFVFFDWQREVQERIKNLEKKYRNEDDITFVRNIKDRIKVTFDVVNKAYTQTPNNSLVLGHRTLGRLRTSRDREVDCSWDVGEGGNNHSATWQGTGIGGSQYQSDGFRLACGRFNGSDNYIPVTDHSDLDLNSDFTIAFHIRLSSLPSAVRYIAQKWDGTDGWAVRITAANKVELIYSNSGSDSTLVTTDALTTNTWTHIAFVKDGTDLKVFVDGDEDTTGTGDAAAGTNTNNVEVGRYSGTYTSMDLDEFMLYDNNLSDANVLNISNKIRVDTDQVLWFSFDDPILGDQTSAKVLVDTF